MCSAPHWLMVSSLMVPLSHRASISFCALAAKKKASLGVSSSLPLFVFIVTVSCEDENNNLSVVDFIHKAVFLRNMTAPLIGTITT